MKDVLLFLIVLFTLVSGHLSCMENHQCSSVTDDYNYVFCNTTTHLCECKFQQGFFGQADTNDKCRCDSPYHVEWESSKPWCVDYELAIKYAKQESRCEVMKNSLYVLYNASLWPNALIPAHQLATDNFTYGIFKLFLENSHGRVDPTGEFGTFDSQSDDLISSSSEKRHNKERPSVKGVVEYFIGQVFNGQALKIRGEFLDMICDENQLYMNAKHRYNLVADGFNFFNYSLSQKGTWNFTDDNLISSFDLVLPNLAWATQPLFSNHPAAVLSTCNTIMNSAHCNSTYDPEGYYDSYEHCVDFNTVIEFGTYDWIRRNNTLCRSFHSVLALLDPYEHCPHAGRGGGGKCQTFPYSFYYKYKF